MLEIISKLVRPLNNEVKNTLKYLSNKYELVVLTNWFTDCQQKRLEKAGILKYFKKVFRNFIKIIFYHMCGLLKIYTFYYS